jgi:hypothetical protein
MKFLFSPWNRPWRFFIETVDTTLHFFDCCPDFICDLHNYHITGERE